MLFRIWFEDKIIKGHFLLFILSTNKIWNNCDFEWKIDNFCVIGTQIYTKFDVFDETFTFSSKKLIELSQPKTDLH